MRIFTPLPPGRNAGTPGLVPARAALAVFLAGASFAPAAVAGGAPFSTLKKMSFEELMDLEVISVSRRPEKLLEAASAIQVLTGDEIRRSGATGIPEALRLADNLQVAQKNSHGWGISARGFNADLANKLLVMIDGRTVYTPLFSGVFWNAQDYLLEDLERIEVVSGPGGTLWGANAVNGVINILSRHSRDTQGLYLEGGAGTALENFAGARYGGMLAPEISYRIYGRHLERDHLGDESGRPAHDSWRMSQGGFRLDAETDPNRTFTWQGDLYSGRADVPTGGTGKFSGGNLLTRWTQRFSPESQLTVQLYYDRTYLDDPITNQFGPTSTLIDKLDTYDLDLQHGFRLNARNRVGWGIGYRFTHNVVQSAQNLAVLPAHLDHELFSGFLQDEIALAEDLSLTLGSKLEHNGYTGRETEPGARLQWNFAPEKSLWLAVSRAVRTPSRVDRDAFQPKPPGSILAGNPNFRSETVIAYEAGYRAALGSRGTMSVSTFYNDYDDLRSLGFTPATIVPLFFQNNLQAETYGIEINATYQLRDWWRIRAGYTALKEHLRVRPGTVDLGNQLNETSDPGQQASLRSSMDLARRVELDAGFRWVDTLHNNNGNNLPGTVPGYLELDVRLAYRPSDHLEISIVGQNLLHEGHPEFGPAGPGREDVRRSAYAKLTWRY